jgi:hypothetical protein
MAAMAVLLPAFGLMLAGCNTDTTDNGNRNEEGWNRTLLRILVKTMPQKTVYALNEDPDYTGLLIYAYYDDGGPTEEVSYPDPDLKFEGFDKTTAGDKTITVTYNEKSTTFPITTLNVAKDDFLKEWADKELYLYRDAYIPTYYAGEKVSGKGDIYKLSISDEGKTVEFTRTDTTEETTILFKLEGVTAWEPLSDGRKSYDVGFALSGGTITQSSASVNANEIEYLQVYKGTDETTNGQLYLNTLFNPESADPYRYYGVMQ